MLTAFSDENIWYTIDLVVKDNMTFSKGCGCPYYLQEQSVCKHMWLLLLARSVPPHNTVSPAQPTLRLKRPIWRPFPIPVKEATTEELKDKAESLEQSIMELLSVVAKAKEDPGHFEEQHLTTLDACVKALYHTAHSQHTKEPPTKVQRLS